MNNQKSMEFNAQTGVLQCNFNYMQLRRIKRNTDKKATEIVMEEKFTLLFKAKFVIAGGELEIPVMVRQHSSYHVDTDISSVSVTPSGSDSTRNSTTSG